MTTLTLEHGGTGMPDRVTIEGLVEMEVNFSDWHEAEEWELTVRPSRVNVIDTSKREQVRSVIYDEMKREESERKIRQAMVDAIDRELARIAEVTQVPETFLSYRRSCEDYSYPQRFIVGIDPAIDPDRIVTGSISADYITLDGPTLTDEREETLRSYYEGDLRAVRSDSFTFTTTDCDPDLLTLLYGGLVPYEEDDIDHCC